MNNDEEQKYFNVPIYIEKIIKKLYKLKDQQTELLAQLTDYMEHHDIPKETPLSLLKYFPPEEVDPNQMQLDI